LTSVPVSSPKVPRIEPNRTVSFLAAFQSHSIWLNARNGVEHFSRLTMQMMTRSLCNFHVVFYAA